MSSTPRSILKNFTVTALLGVLVFWLGFESAERGVFKFSREAAVDNTPNPPPPDASITVKPGPTALPLHFPTVSETDLSEKHETDMPLIEAFSSCWPKISVTLPPAEGDLTPKEVQALFGQIKKREVLSNSGGSVQIGLLFDKSVFPDGAAGSATENGGRWTELRFRAAGRMLHCENPHHCECI